MAIVALRLFIFTLFPTLLAQAVIQFDRSVNSRGRALETLPIFLLAIGVTANGIFNFVAHFFSSDVVAASIGWEAGSPFQLEVGFANLAFGVLGIVATGRRDGFREATVIAVTTFAVGATIVHLMDIVTTGNLAPGNSLQNVANLLRPALLIWALVASRRAETSPEAEVGRVEFDRSRMPLVQSSAPLAISISTAYGLGFGLGRPWLVTLLGLVIGVLIVALVLVRSPWHQLGFRRDAKRNG